MNQIHSTDQDWDALGAIDPYFAVITQPQYHKETLCDATREEFFRSGKRHVDNVILPRIPHDGITGRALDFGCGVGRIAIPLARYYDQVVGADVSANMLSEARSNCNQMGVDNLSFVQTTDMLDEIKGSFQLVHSYIVMQHIPVDRGVAIFERLVKMIAPGGYGSIQVTYSKNHYSDHLETQWPSLGPNGVKESPNISWMEFLKKKWSERRFRQGLRTSNQRRITPQRQAQTSEPNARPVMQMNPYTLNPLFHLLQNLSVRELSVQLTSHGGEWGTHLFFQVPNSEANLNSTPQGTTLRRSA